MWFLKNNMFVKLFNSFLSDLASPINLLWFWNFGFMLGMAMVLQVISGLLLSLYYSDFMVFAFYSVLYLMLEVEGGSFFRFFHSTGASLMFFLVYIHIGRSLWFKSFFIISVWQVGVVIFIMMMMVSFLGYVLPWGQMSFWAATVITNLLYVVPYVGGMLLEWVWGGFSVGGATLSRFFILHYILPFLILMLSVIHLWFLHNNGSSNPLGVSSSFDKISFHWFYSLKDGVSLVMMLYLLFFMFLFVPYFFMDAENFLVVDTMKTPEHIKPEWYFLFAYCILRSVPNKIGGVLGLLLSIMILMVLPYLKLMEFKFFNSLGKWVTVLTYIIFLMLTWLGGCIVEWPFNLLGKLISVSYFMLFLIWL